MEVSGYLPEGVTARGLYTELHGDRAADNREAAVLALGLVLLDEADQVYVPQEELTITVDGVVINAAACGAVKPQFLVYAYEENADREISMNETYAADVTVYRWQDGGREVEKRLRYKTDRKKDPVRFTEDEDGLLSYEDNTVGFETDRMPLQLVITELLTKEQADGGTKAGQNAAEDGMAAGNLPSAEGVAEEAIEDEAPLEAVHCVLNELIEIQEKSLTSERSSGSFCLQFVIFSK